MKKQQDTFYYIHFLGSNKTGKTTILNKILNKPYNIQKYVQTLIVDPMYQKIDNHYIYYYDTPGKQQLLNQIQFLCLSNIIVLVYDKSDYNTFKYLYQKILQLLKYQAKKQCKIILCENKADLKKPEQIQSLKVKLHNQIRFLELEMIEFQTSCLDQGQNLKQLHNYFIKHGINQGWSCSNQFQNLKNTQMEQLQQKKGQLENKNQDKNNNPKSKKRQKFQLKKKSITFLFKAICQKQENNVQIQHLKKLSQQLYSSQKQTFKKRKLSQKTKKQDQKQYVNNHSQQNQNEKQNKKKVGEQLYHYDLSIIKNDKRKIKAEMRKSMKIEMKAQYQSNSYYCQIM